MLIVLEGCDGVGKTYLAERLKAEINERTGSPSAQIVHHGVPTEDDMYVEYDLKRYYWCPGVANVILDRWHLGEWIYGRLYRGGSQLGLHGVSVLDQALARAGALKLILDAPDAVVAERLKVKGEDYLQVQHQLRVLSEYRMVAQHFAWLKVTSDLDPAILIDWAYSLQDQAVRAW